MADVLSWIGVVGGVAGGVAAVYTATRAKAIEKYRAELQAEGYEHEVRFARLHERRVEVIAELYGRLVRAEAAITAYVHPFEVAGGQTKDELSVPAQGRINDFIGYFRESRIWLDVALEGQVSDYIDKLNEAGVKFTVFVRHRGEEDRHFEQWGEAWDVVDKQTPPLRKAIETQMRQMLGIPPAKGA